MRNSHQKLTCYLLLFKKIEKHPLTRTQLDIVKGFWNLRQGECQIKVVDPQVKILACGEEGTGAMASVSDIVTAARSSLQF